MPKIKFHAYALMLLLCMALVASISVKPLTAAERVNCEFTHIPATLGDYTSTDEKFSSDTYSELRSASLLLRKYSSPRKGGPIELAIVYGVDLGDFHQPDICLAGQGLRTVERGIIDVKDAGGKPLQVVSLVTESDEGRDAFMYWFCSKDSESTSLGNYKMRLMVSRLLRRGILPSAMIRISTPVEGSSDEALSKLADFAGRVSPYVIEEIKAGGSPR
jgi:EpsI family protein